MPNLVLTRHGQSEWNKKNLFTGFKDVDLTEQGRQEAIAAGKAIGEKGIKFDHVFTSTLKRAYHTAELLLEASGTNEHLKQVDGHFEMVKHDDLRERDYGDLTGYNKDEMREKYGEEQVHIWRRSYDTPPPGGEALADVVKRVEPYYNKEIKPLLEAGKTVLIAAHGNSLRALLIVLGIRTADNINDYELATGQPIYLDV